MVVYAREIDYNNRDPNGINENIHVLFRDVLAEPERTLHSMNCVWKYSAKFYRGGKNCCYTLLTYLLGVPISIYWGCVFACTSFVQVWCCTPLVRINSIMCNLCLFYNIIMSSTFLAPIWDARAYFLRRINVTYSAGQLPDMLVIDRVFSGSNSKGQYKPVYVPPLNTNYAAKTSPREYIYDTSPRNYNSQRYDNSPREYQPAQPQQYKQQYQPQQQPQYQPQQPQYQPQQPQYQPQPVQQYKQAPQQVPQQQYRPQQQPPQQSYRQPYDQAPPARQYQPPPQNSYRQPNNKPQTYRQAAPTTRDYVQQQHNPQKSNRNYDYPNNNKTWRN